MALFTHLHVHSHFSLLEGTASPAALAQRAAAAGMTHLALTDRNALYGAVAFDRACRAAGVQPVTGMTVTVAAPDGRADEPGELVLLACNPAGYRALCRLSSHIQGHPERERLARRGLSWETLRAQREGLICLSGGRRGLVERALRAGDTAGAARLVSRLAGLYGEQLYLVLERHTPADVAVSRAVQSLGDRFGLGTVAVQPIHCLESREQSRLRLLAAIDHNCPLDAVPAALLPDRGDPDVRLHWPEPADLHERFADAPQALEAAGAIASQCGRVLPDGGPIWPAPQLPANVTPDQALAELAEQGLQARYPPGEQAAARPRLAMELAAIARQGYAPLFLVVADLVRYARSREIPVSTRGSVADSLAAYCAGITTIDPIRHDLIFERFLNPARSGLPDIDLDFCSRRRDEVLAYVRATYGAERMALVATVSTMRPKSALRETAKAHGLDDATTSRLLRHVPSGRHPDPRRREKAQPEAVLAGLNDPAAAARLRPVVEQAFALVGQPHHLSIHPGGVVITPGPLTDVTPVQMAPKGFLITQFEHGDVEALGLPKIDLLGIRALTVLADAAALVRKDHDPGFSLETIADGDAATGDLIRRGETIGVFQCESTGAQRTLRQLQARTVRDLAVANAFFKPGPATGGMAQSFIRRYRGEEPTSFLHPALEPILGATHGVLLFQEQILRLAVEVAGLSWDDADHLRRGMSKFQPQEMASIRERFVAGCMRPAPDGPAFAPAQAATLWEQVAAFAGYGFNQGHATAYADVSYRSAYLKAHWPAAFLCARLVDWGGFHHQAVYIAEAQRLGMAVRPPHVNHSRRAFRLTWEGDAPVLWMGLGQVRALRRNAVRDVLAARRSEPFRDLRDLLDRVALQPRELTNLIRCGGLDGLGASRTALLAQVADLRRAGSLQQMAFAFAAQAPPPESAATRVEWEQQILGQPVSVHPAALLSPDARGATLADCRAAPGKLVTLAGVRLPGWTGGKGFFFSDGATFAVTLPPQDQRAPRPWQLVRLRGRWRLDDWDGGRLVAERLQPVDPKEIPA